MKVIAQGVTNGMKWDVRERAQTTLAFPLAMSVDGWVHHFNVVQLEALLVATKAAIRAKLPKVTVGWRVKVACDVTPEWRYECAADASLCGTRGRARIFTDRALARRHARSWEKHGWRAKVVPVTRRGGT